MPPIPPESPLATHLIRTLNLSHLPQECGYIGLLGRSTHSVLPLSPPCIHPESDSPSPPPAPLAAQSHNYYMLTTAQPTNHLHRLVPSDTHVLLQGGPVDYYIFHAPSPSSSPKVEKLTMGTDLSRGHVPVISVPGGCWKALRLHAGAELALMVNVLSPEFTGGRVRIGEGEAWVGLFRGRAEWATEEGLRELIGEENWRGKGE